MMTGYEVRNDTGVGSGMQVVFRGVKKHYLSTLRVVKNIFFVYRTDNVPFGNNYGARVVCERLI